MESEKLVEIPPLHKNQQKVWDAYFSGKYQVFVINAGRRFGKSTCCEAIAMEEAINHGKKVWWIAPTYKVLGEQWNELKDILKGIYTDKNEVDKSLKFHYDLPDGRALRGGITFRSADKPDNLRGSGLDLIIMDEAAFQSPEVWKTVRPAIIDRKGKVIFISTPFGHNFFYTLFQRGKSDNTDPRYKQWKSFHFTSYDNPFLDPLELEKAKADMTETEFRIEHLAEFIDDIGKVFSNVHKCAVAPLLDIPKHPGLYSMGIDLARKHDATVVTVLDLRTNTQVFGTRFIGLDWDLQRAKLVSLIKAFNPRVVYAEINAVGAIVLEDLQKVIPDHVRLMPFFTSFTSKPVLIQGLAVKLQNQEINILSGESDFGKIQIEELLAYEIKQSKDGLKFTYGAPRGSKDDTVIALALACMGITGQGRLLKSSTNPFFPQAKKKKDRSSRHQSIYASKSYELKKALLEKEGLL